MDITAPEYLRTLADWITDHPEAPLPDVDLSHLDPDRDGEVLSWHLTADRAAEDQLRAAMNVEWRVEQRHPGWVSLRAAHPTLGPLLIFASRHNHGSMPPERDWDAEGIDGAPEAAVL